MTNRALTLFSLSVATGVLLAASTAAAQPSQCSPYDLFCGQLQIGPAQGTVRIGPAEVVPPAPVLQPPVVIVQPQAPIQPPQVYIQPAPPQPVYVQQQPQYVQQPQYMPQYQQPQYYPRPRPQLQYPESSMGLTLHADGMFTDHVAMAGAGAGVRFRPNPYIGIDLGAGIYGGQDYNNLSRVEVPVTADFLVFFNPYNRFQFYSLIGIGGSWAHAQGQNAFTLTSTDRDMGYLGGELGLGVEWRISQSFAMNLDVRGFLRQRVDNSATPEFTSRDSAGRIQSTDTSGGVVGRLGMTFYWGQ